MIKDLNQLDFTKQYTYADYLTWQFDERVELIRGWISKLETPWVIHQRILGNLIYQIGCYLENKKQEVHASPLMFVSPINRKSVPTNPLYQLYNLTFL